MKPQSFVIYLLVLIVQGFAGSLEAGDSPVMEISDAETAVFSSGVRLFSDRLYTPPDIPERLAGTVLVRSTIDRTRLVCREPGLIYALTPPSRIPGTASQELALLELGFKPAGIPEFQLFGQSPINRVVVLCKTLARGESLALGKWVVLLAPSGTQVRTPSQRSWAENDGERLYNGIVLPQQWPPGNQNPKAFEPMVVPYLQHPPQVIPIDVGRQLFVDDFLIEDTSLWRRFHRAEKYEGNPVLKAETALELNDGAAPVACPFSDGVFFDPTDRQYKMWYHAGWFDGTAYATSQDGLHWTRPSLDVVPGTNRVIPPHADFHRDGVSVWIDHETANPAERYKMFLYSRSNSQGSGGHLLTSADGIHWNERARTEVLGDNSTFFYNPFRKKWVFSIRSGRNQRTRDYWEATDFLAAEHWLPQAPVFWIGADRLDLPDPQIRERTQLYKLDAVGYESLLLGLMQIHYGPPNDACRKGKFPKVTELELGFSRDGFHWDRTSRDTFIGATQKPGDWNRAYIHSVGGVCLIVHDKLYFYYGAWSGESPKEGTGMYAGGNTCVAFLRRDGFASMDADQRGGTLTTRPVIFQGRHLFVNLAASQGELRVEVLNEAGQVIAPFSAENCAPLGVDATCQPVHWKGANDLSAMVGRKVKFRFYLRQGQLYAFWVTPDAHGASYGYVAAGGPEFHAPVDTPRP